jgi:hypothetical protein
MFALAVSKPSSGSCRKKWKAIKHSACTVIRILSFQSSVLVNGYRHEWSKHLPASKQAFRKWMWIDLSLSVEQAYGCTWRHKGRKQKEQTILEQKRKSQEKSDMYTLSRIYLLLFSHLYSTQPVLLISPSHLSFLLYVSHSISW